VVSTCMQSVRDLDEVLTRDTAGYQRVHRLWGTDRRRVEGRGNESHAVKHARHSVRRGRQVARALGAQDGAHGGLGLGARVERCVERCVGPKMGCNRREDSSDETRRALASSDETGRALASSDETGRALARCSGGCRQRHRAHRRRCLGHRGGRMRMLKRLWGILKRLWGILKRHRLPLVPRPPVHRRAHAGHLMMEAVRGHQSGSQWQSEARRGAVIGGKAVAISGHHWPSLAISGK